MAAEATRGRGRIPDRDIAAIRERVNIEDVVGDYVQLRRAGADSMKGLCPFHDEKSPSFHVRPNHGHFHCFGCGEGGDVYAFLQKIEHVSFVEAVELLADRVGYTVTYTGGSTTNVQRDRGSRSRLLAANAAAQEFYAEQLQSEEAALARQYLLDRNFDAAAATKFGCGFAPSGWETLTKHLLRKGFEFKELEAAGLSREGRRGPMDRFHRRLLWPIRASGGEVIGFGARRIFDDDPMEAKYVNTPETVLYKKSSVLFGLDLAKRDIAKAHRAVVVEGYTDVMAMHLAGETTAVASCGTAFGDSHLSLLRRLMMDDNWYRGELIFVFDGDAAGQAAALKAFDGDQQVAGKSFVAVAADGMDPCDLRLKSGDGALRDLVARRIPMFEFAVRSLIPSGDILDNDPHAKVDALRQCVPLVSRIRDYALRDEYARRLAGWTGWSDESQVLSRVREEAAKRGMPERGRRRGAEQPAAPRGVAAPAPGASRPDPADPTLWPQREALKSALQFPALAGPVFDSLTAESFTHPGYAAVRAAIGAAGGTSAGLSGAQWIEAVRDQATSPPASSLINELGVEAINADDERLPRYIGSVLARLQEVWIGRQIAEVKSKLQRMSPVEQGDEYHALFGDLVAMEAYRRSLLEQASGNDLTA
ncbi:MULTISPECIES: DNA primase [Mycolicibacterium]|uniref:DNA primase n=2 Tax=Mycolicibacterium gilvum TaxID=1804 RepID=E6TEN1_MYCSR|nr:MULTISPECIES: DNA primase [Mycolicibacterium]ABP45199.1 DNA primase [Mycolicibacterium gilvum PYR-GCK]ADT98813.1 DNA primase [Mycolicibacterium gilvum Spyr1]MBV5243233.1 DNA primase [Mycolicibacterium sp. PAM1]